jgi:N-hydroxyarylamine O-acetyltransferase
VKESFNPDLDAYFERIGDTGSRDPNLATLNRIVEAHIRTIPFENLDVVLGHPISVQPADIERKLVHRGRGGYCFEQNSLLQFVLIALGYAVQPISARVCIQKPRSFTAPRTHLFLRVELDGEAWLADVGVGSFSPTCALRLVLNDPQITPHEMRRIVSVGDWSGLDRRAPDAVLYHQVLLGDAWEDICEFTLEEMQPVDRELGNWFTSAHPDSQFRSQIKVSRSTGTGRITLLDRELKKRGKGAEVVIRLLRSDEEVLETLREEFGICLPAGTSFAHLGL